jgi:DNA polymerase III sliding clamp (beta) subunit (PCNA family)
MQLFASILRLVLPALDGNEGHKWQQLYLSIVEGSQVLTLMATNGHRSARFFVGIEPSPTTLSFFISTETAYYIQKLVDRSKPYGGEVGAVMLSIDDFLRSVQLSVGVIPFDLRSCKEPTLPVPCPPINRVVLLSEDIKSLLKDSESSLMFAATVLSTDSRGDVVLSCRKRKRQMTWDRPLSPSQDWVVAVRSRYLLDAVSALNCESIRLCFTGPYEPVVLTDAAKSATAIPRLEYTIQPMSKPGEEI